MGGESPPFLIIMPISDPTQIAGLGIWFDASQLAGAVGADVSPWPNLVAGGATGAIIGAPAPKVSVNALNGLKLVRFTINEGRVRATATGIDKAFTLAYVARMVPGGYIAGRIVNASYQPANFLIGYWNGFEDVAYTTTAAFWLPDVRKSVTTNWNLYSADADDAPNFYPRMFNKGVLLSTGGSGGVASGSDGFANTFNLSGYDPTGASETCDCEVAEVVLYSRKLSDAERQSVEGYLWTKWFVLVKNVVGSASGVGGSSAVPTRKRRLVAASASVATTLATITRRKPLGTSPGARASGTTTVNAAVSRIRALSASTSGKATTSGTISSTQAITSSGPSIVYAEDLVPAIIRAEQLVPYIYTSTAPTPVIYNGEYLAPHLYAKDEMVPVIVRSEEI
jgi:hypothetical protein